MKLRNSIWLSLFFLASCVSFYTLDEAQNSLRNSIVAGNYEQTVALVNDLEKKEVYKSKDRLLLYLEKGTALHFAGQYKESFANFEEAEITIENNFTKSISRGLKSLAVNDNLLVYDGEDYEDIYINAFKALNFIQMNDLDGALIESRRMIFKIENLNIKHNGLSDALSKKDTTGKVSFKPGKAEIQSSSFAHYLNTILFSKNNDSDNARIEYDRFLEAGYQQQSLTSKTLGYKEVTNITQPEKFNTLIVAFAGSSPRKKQKDTRVYLEEDDIYLKLSLPVLRMNTSEAHKARILLQDGSSYDIPLIEPMDRVAREIYKIKEPIIYARTYIRVFAKLGIQKFAEKEAKDADNDGLKDFISIVGKITQEVTEKADLRSWQTLPGEVYSSVIQLEPGDHTVTIEYLDETNYVIHSEEKLVTVQENNPLTLIETSYWN